MPTMPLTTWIPKERLPSLKNYKYQSADNSLISRYVLGPYWTWLVTLFPLSMAPNMITFFGFLCVVVNFAVVSYLNPTLDKEMPRWVHLLSLVSLWVYQSLDAIDGKQARRTGQSGPLGELFDHGCDALNTTLVVVCACASFGTGMSYFSLIVLLCSSTAFFLTTWDEFHTHILYLGIFSGPVEGLLMLMTTFLATAIFGSGMWQMSVGAYFNLAGFHFDNALMDRTVLEVAQAVFIATVVVNVVQAWVNVQRAAKSSRGYAVLTMLPFVAFAVSSLAWAAHSQNVIFREELMIPYMCLWGIIFAYMVCLVTLRHVTQNPYFPYLNAPLVLYYFGAINAVTGHVVLPSAWEIWYIYGLLGFGVLYFALYVVRTVDQICKHLDIWCLSIKYPKVLKAQ